MTSIYIPAAVTSIGRTAFSDGLTKAEFASIEALCNINFSKTDSNPLYYAHHLYIDGKEVTDVVIPEGVTSLTRTFTGCGSVKSVSFPESVTTIGPNAFYGCSGLTSVKIPGSVMSFGAQAFYGCNSIAEIYYMAEKPVSATSNVFANTIYDSAMLYVPNGCAANYESVAPWNMFKNIKELDKSAISDIESDEANGNDIDYNRPYEIYNLNGVRVGADVNAMNSGLYVIRQGAKVVKRFVR